MTELTLHRAVLRTLPARIAGYGNVRPFTGAFDNLGIVEKAPVGYPVLGSGAVVARGGRDEHIARCPGDPLPFAAVGGN